MYVKLKKLVQYSTVLYVLNSLLWINCADSLFVFVFNYYNTDDGCLFLTGDRWFFSEQIFDCVMSCQIRRDTASGDGCDLFSDKPSFSVSLPYGSVRTLLAFHNKPEQLMATVSKKSILS